MFGILKDIIDTTSEVVGTAVGIATYPISIALGVSERMVKKAVKAGCKTQQEIKEWIERNS